MKTTKSEKARPGGGEEGELLDPQQVADEVRARDDKEARENAAWTIEALVRRAGRSEQSGALGTEPSQAVRSSAWLGVREKTTLARCPVGLFVWSGELCFKSEYSTGGRPDAYVVASGEYFWGGTDSPEAVGGLRVTPIEVRRTPSGAFSDGGGSSEL